MTRALFSAALADAGFAHAFFTRSASPDSAEAAGALGVAQERLYLLRQVHGKTAVIADGGAPAEALLEREGDIAASRAPGLACGVRVADCAPILLAATHSGAVAAVHSGWRGTVLRVAQAGVRVLREISGPGEIVAAIGPHLEACCFEVGPDVAAEIAASCRLGGAAVDFSRARPHVDLRAVIADQLAEAGVRVIDQVRGCTACDPARFHSFRRDRQNSGRMLAAIVARAQIG